VSLSTGRQAVNWTAEASPSRRCGCLIPVFTQVFQYRLGSPSLRDELTLTFRQQARPYFPDPFLQAIPQVLDQEALEEELFRELPTVSPFLFLLPWSPTFLYSPLSLGALDGRVVRWKRKIIIVLPSVESAIAPSLRS
jgi:hypothetical protein